MPADEHLQLSLLFSSVDPRGYFEILSYSCPEDRNHQYPDLDPVSFYAVDLAPALAILLEYAALGGAHVFSICLYFCVVDHLSGHAHMGRFSGWYGGQ